MAFANLCNISVTNVLDLHYAPLAGHKIFKMNIHNLLQKCFKCTSKANISIELVGTLSGQIAPIASAQNVIFFSNIPGTSIHCVDATKKFSSNNSVRCLIIIILCILFDNKLFCIFYWYFINIIMSIYNDC